MKVKHLTDLPNVAAYLARIGAEPRSLRTAVVRETRGKYWTDIAKVSFTKDGEVSAPKLYAPDESEAKAIKTECAAADWPNLNRIPSLIQLPKELKEAPKDDLYVFRDKNDLIVMVQQRMDIDGEKRYVPWTYWDDNEWRRMEPDGALPLWGLEQLKNHTVVFIHEGAKAARKVARMVAGETVEAREALKNHPWGQELSHAAHLGWIGGALSPGRTDWRSLNKGNVKRVYIVSDNDLAGVMAVPRISYHLKVPTFHIQFTEEWPASFDLADEFPESMFTDINGYRHYCGPSFRTCTHPATWATDQLPNPSGRGKPILRLRDSFIDQWLYCEQAEVYVNKEMPEILRSGKSLNVQLLPWIHNCNISAMIANAYAGRKTQLAYRPDMEGRMVSDGTTSAVNLHRPSDIRPKAGDPTPWLEFLKYMFPIERERMQVKRWCATLIGRPEIRMEYGLLLVSESQGIGKTTLGANILAPLVGKHNTSFPSENTIVNSSFNSWLANKRLIVIGEIYSGHSWKAYNKLKGYITDKEIEVNEKYMKPYVVDNWAHIVACSNSRRALKVEQDDRRWFYPEVTEISWKREQFEDLHEWLRGGGLPIILHWAQNYGDYCRTGERAPMTGMKMEMIEGSRSEAQKELIDLCQAIKDEEISVAFSMREVKAWLIERPTIGRLFDTDYELRRAVKDIHWGQLNRRIKIAGQLQYVLLSPQLMRDLRNEKFKNDADENAFVRQRLNHPANMTQEAM